MNRHIRFLSALLFGSCLLFSAALHASAEKTTQQGAQQSHVHIIIKNEAVPASCEENGYTEHYSCISCGKLFSDETFLFELTEEDITIPALGHEWGEGVITREPTADEEGELTYTCKNDPSHTRTETIPALGGESEPEQQAEEPATQNQEQAEEEQEQEPAETVQTENTDNTQNPKTGACASCIGAVIALAAVLTNKRR